jgi:hypothetical protein
MRTLWRSLALAGIVTVGGLEASSARAQAFNFGYASPGFSFGVASGGPGSSGGFYGGVPLVAPVPAVVPPAPFVVRPRVVVPRPYYRGYYAARRYYPYYRR